MVAQSFSLEAVEGAPWAFIAVMGVTGAGKSTFVQWASGNPDIIIGHDLESCKSFNRRGSGHVTFHILT